MYRCLLLVGEQVTTTVEGRERYPVSILYLRDCRCDVEKVERVLIATPTGAQSPLGQAAQPFGFQFKEPT